MGKESKFSPPFIFAFDLSYIFTWKSSITLEVSICHYLYVALNLAYIGRGEARRIKKEKKRLKKDKEKETNKDKQIQGIEFCSIKF